MRLNCSVSLAKFCRAGWGERKWNSFNTVRHAPSRFLRGSPFEVASCEHGLSLSKDIFLTVLNCMTFLFGGDSLHFEIGCHMFSEVAWVIEYCHLCRIDSFPLKPLQFLFFVNECFSICMSLYHVCNWCPWRTGGYIRSSGTEVTHVYEPSWRGWESNPDPWHEWQMILAAESSL